MSTGHESSNALWGLSKRKKYTYFYSFYPLAPLFAVEDPNTTEASSLQELMAPIFNVSALIYRNPKAPVLSHRLWHCGAHKLPDTHLEEFWALWRHELTGTAPSLWPAANPILRNSTWALEPTVRGLFTCACLQTIQLEQLGIELSPGICIQNLTCNMCYLLSYSRW